MPPDGADKVLLELWVRREEVAAKIKASRLRMARAQTGIELLKRALERHKLTMANLKNRHTVIVSLREYIQILNDIKKTKKILRDTIDYIQIEEAAISVMSEEMAAIDRAIDKRLNPRNLLHFRPRS